MLRTTSLAAVALSVVLHSVAAAQDGNPLDGEREPAAREGSRPAWAGVFLDRGAQRLLLLSPRGEAEVEGLLLVVRGREVWEVEGRVERGADGLDGLTGTIARGEQRFSFVAQAQEGLGLAVRSGSTVSLWSRATDPQRLDEAASVLKQARANANEAAALGALKTIMTAQVLFREGDKDGNRELDYAADLEQLARVNLIDRTLASGVKNGYRFEVRRSSKNPEFEWIATATPVEPGQSGRRHFVINHAGVIYVSTDAPFTPNDDCAIPPGATPLGR